MNRRGQKEYVMEHRAEIAARWRGGEPLHTLRKSLGVSDRTLKTALLVALGPEGYTAIAHERMAANCRGKGRTYQKGHVPWHKGKTLRGRWGAPVGTIRIYRRTHKRGGSGRPYTCRERYIKVSMNRGDKNWVRLAPYRWEKEHGPIPPGYFVFHADGNTLNDDPSNYVLRTRAENARHTVLVTDQAKKARRLSRTRKRQGEESRQLRAFYREQAAKRAATVAQSEQAWDEEDDWFYEEVA